MKYLFHIDSNNDLDHLSPVAWKLLETGHEISYLSNIPLTASVDHRVRLLSRFSTFSIVNESEIFSNRYLKLGVFLRRALFNRLVRRILPRKPRVAILFFILRTFLRNHLIRESRFDALIYGWSEPERQNFYDAQAYGIPNICLPHGYPCYTNYDINPHIKDIRESTGKWPNFSNRDDFDVYVVQTDRHRRWSIDWNQSEQKVEAWGNARFSVEWSAINLQLLDSYQPSLPSDVRQKVLFLLPFNAYTDPSVALIELLIGIAAEPSLFLALKGHTRGDGYLKSKWALDLFSRPNVELCTDSQTPSLVRWADVVINFATGTAIEALHQGKPLIHTTYLTQNTSSFESCQAVHFAHCKEDVFRLLEEARNGRLETDRSHLDDYFRDEIYAGQEPFDVLQHYCDRIILTRSREQLESMKRTAASLRLNS